MVIYNRWKKGLLSAIIPLFLAAPALGWHGGNVVTPYGDYCPMASRYGVMKRKMMSINEVRKVLLHYYHHRGYSVWIVKIEGRFLRINVLKGKKIVDTIIFDRQTGRLRSVY